MEIPSGRFARTQRRRPAIKGMGIGPRHAGFGRHGKFDMVFALGGRHDVFGVARFLTAEIIRGDADNGKAERVKSRP